MMESVCNKDVFLDIWGNMLIGFPAKELNEHIMSHWINPLVSTWAYDYLSSAKQRKTHHQVSQFHIRSNIKSTPSVIGNKHCINTLMPVRNIMRILILAEKQIHIQIILDFPEIHMTSALKSLPTCLLEEHQWGDDAQTVPCRPHFRCHFQKPWLSNWCLFCFIFDMKKSK